SSWQTSSWDKGSSMTSRRLSDFEDRERRIRRERSSPSILPRGLVFEVLLQHHERRMEAMVQHLGVSILRRPSLVEHAKEAYHQARAVLPVPAMNVDRTVRRIGQESEDPIHLVVVDLQDGGHRLRDEPEAEAFGGVLFLLDHAGRRLEIEIGLHT